MFLHENELDLNCVSSKDIEHAKKFPGELLEAVTKHLEVLSKTKEKVQQPPDEGERKRKLEEGGKPETLLTLLFRKLKAS
jgi:hypothetical protein